jgi:hypothetical protein
MVLFAIFCLEERCCMSLRLASFTMMKNEAAILNPFLDQLTEFFDASFILDHDSVDRSVELVCARGDSRLRLFRLKTAGYPQSEVTTFFAHRIFSETDADFLFFLDCDEFLPFANKQALEKWLVRNSNCDALKLPWLNVCPSNLEGSDIFRKPFSRGTPNGKYGKIILRKTVLEAAPTFIVAQGNHDIITTGAPIKVRETGDKYLIHIPVQSKLQLSLKAVTGSHALMADQSKLKNGLGRHWVFLATRLACHPQSDAEISEIALTYPGLDQHQSDGETPQISKLDFEFPYVRSAYEEHPDDLAARIADLSKLADRSQTGDAYFISDIAGNIIMRSCCQSSSDTSPKSPLISNQSFAKHYEDLVAPLFDLPTKLVPSTWNGHIPFLFVLFKLIQPQTYVELGVHTGGSFIAACTAARAFGLLTNVTGIDTWKGDPHAGFFDDGDKIYRELKNYTDGMFENAKLMRASFAEARRSFKNDSIDILHIDGYHTFEAVYDDFSTWFPTLKSTGIILFHDICVYERNFGVHRLWAELRSKFETVEFRHSFGLGILFLDPNDTRIDPLMRIARDPQAWRFYQDLLAEIALHLPERAGYFVLAAAQSAAAQSPPMEPSPTALLEMLYRSRILRTFGPLSKSWRFTKRILQAHSIVKT